MLTIKRYISHFATCLALAVAFTACVNENLPCPVEHEDDSQGVTIEFSLVTRNASSAHGSRGLLPADNPLIGIAAENYLDLDNLLFLLFDDTQTLIRAFRPDVELSTDVADAGAGPYAKYKVRAFLNDSYFLDATDGDITFSIVVLGNYQGLSPARFAYHNGLTLSEIFATDKVGTFGMPYVQFSEWIPSFPNGKVIPMAGLQTFTVSVASLKASSVDKPFQLTGGTGNGKYINMLRALAKIEIIDRIGAVGTGAETQQPLETERSVLEKAELIGYTSRGSILPTLSQWNLTSDPLETQYVTAPSVPSDAVYEGFAPINDQLTIPAGSNAIQFFVDAQATANRADGCKVLSCYLTEYNPELLRPTDEPMWLRLTVQPPGEGAASIMYRLEVAPYVNNNPVTSLPILRNNIYRYEITGFNTPLGLTLVVEDWHAETTEWSYSANPALAEEGYMQWSVPAGNTLDLTDETATIVYTAPLTGTFAFDEPKGGTWTASFIPVGQTANDAFMFIDGDGNQVSTVSGSITGAETSIRVVTKYTPSQDGVNRVARLLFTVRTVDGRILTANVLGGKYGKNTYFTIIQNAAQ